MTTQSGTTIQEDGERLHLSGRFDPEALKVAEGVAVETGASVVMAYPYLQQLIQQRERDAQKNLQAALLNQARLEAAKKAEAEARNQQIAAQRALAAEADEPVSEASEEPENGGGLNIEAIRRRIAEMS